VRLRFWAEIGTASTTGVLALLTALCPEWIEYVLGWSPDQHSGSLEWYIVAAFFLQSTGLFALARMEWTRTRAQTST
jgi:hypothetical protein